MNEWQPIDTAPKNGQTITVRRIFEGQTIFEGPAAWRTVVFPPLAPDPLNREPIGDEGPLIATGWMHPTKNLRVPEPTAWLPR